MYVVMRYYTSSIMGLIADPVCLELSALEFENYFNLVTPNHLHFCTIPNNIYTEKL